MSDFKMRNLFSAGTVRDTGGKHSNADVLRILHTVPRNAGVPPTLRHHFILPIRFRRFSRNRIWSWSAKTTLLPSILHVQGP